MRRQMVIAAALAAAAAGAGAQAPLDLGAKVDPWNVKHFRGQDTILVPTVLLHLSVDGSVFVANQGGMLGPKGTVQAKGKFTVAGLEKSFVQELARRVQDDYVQKLRAAGFTVLTYDDIKADPEVVKMGRYKANPEYGVPTHDVMKTDYALVAPTDEQAFDPPMQGYGWQFRKVAKDRNAVVVVPELTFNAPQMWGEKERGYRRIAAGINIAPGMNLMAGMYGFWTPKGAWGGFKLKEMIENVSEKVGDIGYRSDDTPRGANGLNRGLSVFGGSDDIQKTASSYGLIVDKAAYSAAVLRAALAYNEFAANAAARERKGQ